jgi:hypothetical protein
MPLPLNLDELRRALDAPEGFDRRKHRARTEGVRAAFPHSVQYRDLVDGSTCLTYALGLFKDRTYRAVAGKSFRYQIFAGKTFVEWLLENGHLKEIGTPVAGCLVLYFAEGIWKHAGTAAADRRVISQWGTFPVYEHEVFEVPARYGNQVRYFEMPSAERARELFLQFAKDNYAIKDQDISDALQSEA